MKFSLIYEAQTLDASRAGDRQIFEETVEQAVLADQLGFDTFWCVEHTALTNYSHMSAPETVLAFVAGKTERIGIGHGVVCLPPAMNHPVKVAERIATLDLLSKGRVHFGVGKGGTQQEAGTFGYDLATLQPQIDEAMYLIPKIFVQDEIEHHGDFVQIPKRPIHPKPYQDPHPPMYLACTNTESLKNAGGRGMGALVLGFGGPEEIAKKVEVYHQAWDSRDPRRQVGFRPNRHIAALCPAIVLDDNLEARRIGIRGQRYFMESLGYWYGGGERPDPAQGQGDTHAAGRGQSGVKARFSPQGVSVGLSAPPPGTQDANPTHL
uniref:LLM class flavin-dependent oxidoreductase n=1 Tax=Pseudomonas protegens TaxID=380021 RepID=UPI00390600F9